MLTMQIKRDWWELRTSKSIGTERNVLFVGTERKELVLKMSACSDEMLLPKESSNS
jgi:hypothetical protein